MRAYARGAGRLPDGVPAPAASTTPVRSLVDGATAAPVRGIRSRSPTRRWPRRARHLGRTGVEIAPRRMWPTGLPAVGVPLSGQDPAGRAGRSPGAPSGGCPTSAGGPAARARSACRRTGARRGVRRCGRGAGGVGTRRRPLAGAPGRGGVRRRRGRGRRSSRRWRRGSRRSAGCRCWARSRWSGRSAPAGVNSAQRVRALHDAFALPGPAARSTGRCCWSTTRRQRLDDGPGRAGAAACAGAPMVLPFALAVSG